MSALLYCDNEIHYGRMNFFFDCCWKSQGMRENNKISKPTEFIFRSFANSTMRSSVIKNKKQNQKENKRQIAEIA